MANVGRDFLFVQSYNLTDMVDILWSVVADEAHRLDALQRPMLELLGEVETQAPQMLVFAPGKIVFGPVISHQYLNRYAKAIFRNVHYILEFKVSRYFKICRFNPIAIALPNKIWDIKIADIVCFMTN